MLRLQQLVAALLLAALLAGCAAQRIRDESGALMQEGRFEQAVQLLEGGVARHPGSAVLRGGLLQARSEALVRLLAEAATVRASGHTEAARDLLRRALTFDTGRGRVHALLEELDRDDRQRAVLTEAERLVEGGDPRAALLLLAEALKESPRQPELLSLQRSLELEARQTQTKVARSGLMETRPIALDFRNANLRTVLDVVTRHSGVNFILDKDVGQDILVTVLLRSALVQDAVDLIARTHQLVVKILNPTTVLIYPNTAAKQREHQEQVVRVFYLASAEAKGAAAFLSAMLRIQPPFVDERSNMLAIREPSTTIELAERLIALYDTQEPEVLLELEVMEVRSSRLTDLGLRFPDSLSVTPLPVAGATGLTVSSLRALNSSSLGVNVSGILLNLKREVGDFNTLANPRIRARNKEKAEVLIGDKVPVITATTSQSGFVSDSVNYLDVGLKLNVEPTVYADDEVAIRVALEVSSLVREVRTTSGSLAYQLGTRNAVTTLRLRDGETQLLAGLISSDERSSASRVPGLGDLPIAGRLFSAQRDESQRTELVLAITPRVLRNLRRPNISETELWVGTESLPGARAVGGQLRAAPGATLGLRWQAPSRVAVGDVFVATLELESSVPLRGAPVQLAFSPDQLQVLGIEEGDYFQASDAGASFSQSLDSQQGGISAGSLRERGAARPGRGSLLHLRLRATAAGSALIAVKSVDAMASGEAPRATGLPHEVRVEVR